MHIQRMDLEIRHLRLVAAVADHGTLTRAGDVLHLSQSALSHQLRDLEDRLGQRLFVRANRQMTTTPAGERLVQAARAVLTSLEEATLAVRTGHPAAPIPFRIATECCTCYHWLPAVLPRFRERFPRVELRLELPSPPHLLAALCDGRLDLAIMSSGVRDRRVVARPLFDDELLVAVHPNHRLADVAYVPVAELRNETLILYSSIDGSIVMRRVLLPQGVLPKSTITHVRLTEAIIELVKAGIGIAVLAKWSLKPHLDQGTIRGIGLTRHGFRRRWHAVMPRRVASEDYVREFCELVATHAPETATRRVVQFGSERRVGGRRSRDLVRLNQL